MLPQFVFITPNKTNPEMGAGFILYTKEPFYLGRVIKVVPTTFAAIEYRNKFKPLVLAEIDGYAIFIAFAGKLSGNKVEASEDSDLQVIYNKMAKYYYEEKILSNQGYYKRFKL